MSNEKIYHKRQFLNSERGMAAVQVAVEADSYGVNACLEISDCSRMICLELDVYDDDSLSDQLAKLRRLRVVIDATEQAIKSGWRRHLELKRERDKERGK